MPTVSNNRTEQEQPTKAEPIIAFRLSPDLKKKARIRALEEEITVQELCQRAVSRYLDLPTGASSAA